MEEQVWRIDLKVIHGFSTVWGVRVLILHTVPESTVYAFSLRLGTSTFHPSPSALYWKPTKCNKTKKAHKRYIDRRGRLSLFTGDITVYLVVVTVQLPSQVQLFATSWTAACQGSLSLTISWSLPKFMLVASVMLSSHLILWCPLFLLPSIFLSIRDFSNESSVRIRWSKYWSFSFSISPSSEYLGLISPKIDQFDLLAVQGTLRSLLQHHSLKASILWRSAFLMVQLSQPYVTAGKTIALTIQTFVGRTMSLPFNLLSKYV